MGAERDRVDGFGHLEEGLLDAGDWYLWGPYLSERQWGTVREDYSPDGEAWSWFPHDHARSRTYRWGEDGLAGFSDIHQLLCMGLALWNGKDPILKERIFGLAGDEGNHGEDAKEYWWFVDAVPSHAWNRWRYHYPQAEFPYSDLLEENRRRTRHDPEYELLDTGVFDDDRYWAVEVDYAKSDPHDLLVAVKVTNAGPDTAELHVLPTLWFRNTWKWDFGGCPPTMRADTAPTVTQPRVLIDHPIFGELELLAGAAPGGERPELLFCDNETNTERIYGQPCSTPYPKDGIGDHVVGGAASVNPDRTGTKAACWYRLRVDAGATVELRLRLRSAQRSEHRGDPLGRQFTHMLHQRHDEADEFYAELRPDGITDDEQLVMRQAFAGLLWSKQLYNYDVARWLDGDPTQPAPPRQRGAPAGRNARWRNFDAFDLMSMPDTWEYPWFAAWDLAFHCTALAHVDPGFAKYQLLLLCREWFQHPDGAIPSYEWSFDDVNPPVLAWAALEVFSISGGTDVDFLRRVFDKLLVNFTWWVNREGIGGDNLFEGGFMGLDNIGPIDRDHLPVAGTLEQSDATGWMALYALHMATISMILGRNGEPTSDLTVKFLEHFALIRNALDVQGLWDEHDGFYYDRLVLDDGARIPIKVRSMVGVLPVLASLVIDEPVIARARNLGKSFARLLRRSGLDEAVFDHDVAMKGAPDDRRLLLGVTDFEASGRIFERLFDPEEFLSPHGIRSLSRSHTTPYVVELDGMTATIDYEPAESTVPMFGGNSNWRGPVWFPLNYLLTMSIHAYGSFFGESVTVEYPTGSGVHLTLTEVAEDLRRRLIGLFLLRPDGTRPCFGAVERFGTDPSWRDHLLFHEYFHGDDGTGLGASHQTGWTAIVADLIRRPPGRSDIPAFGDLLD